MATTFQMLICGLDGRTSCLRFPTSTICGSYLQEHVASMLRISAEALLIVTGTRIIHSHTSLRASSDGFFPSCSLLLRLRGGKGGFGSLLRGAATKAGQKKTSNFDACRDMSGRRLRHVNAEKKLKEWKAQAKERELEKAANEFLKKQLKQKEDETGCSQVIEKFREETSRAREDVESAVAHGLAEAKKLGKRKVVEDPLPSTSSKRAYIFEIDTIDEDSEDEREGFSDEDMAQVDSDEGSKDNDMDPEERNEAEDAEKNEDMEKSSEDDNTEQGSEARKVEEEVAEKDADEDAKVRTEAAKVERVADEDAKVRSEIEKAEGKSEDEEKNEGKNICKCLEIGHVEKIIPVEVVEDEGYCSSSISVLTEVDLQEQHSCPCEEKTEVGRHALLTCAQNTCNGSNPPHIFFENIELKELSTQSKLDLCDYLHASDLEVLGLERLKQELQARGLKCGGSLAERAARLFLLKKVSLEKLDKKHFAKAKL